MEISINSVNMVFIDKFEGNLRYINPNRIFNPKSNSDFDNFFLVLAYIFNDLKGLNFLYLNFINTVSKPIDEKATPHNGEYSGIALQYKRLLVSLIYEFIKFLEINKIILDSHEFKILIKKTPKPIQNIWDDFFQVIKDQKSSKNEVVKTLLRIRANITFHYFDAGKPLKAGFINHFYCNNNKTEANSHAYYSDTGIMSTSRFYYADAAASAYYLDMVQDIKDFDKIILGLSENINFGILKLLKVYLANRP